MVGATLLPEVPSSQPTYPVWSLCRFDGEEDISNWASGGAPRVADHQDATSTMPLTAPPTVTEPPPAPPPPSTGSDPNMPQDPTATIGTGHGGKSAQPTRIQPRRKAKAAQQRAVSFGQDGAAAFSATTANLASEDLAKVLFQSLHVADPDDT